METDWSLDYCLACDCQTAGEAYCSQICRLADLETSSCGSEPSSPSSVQPAMSFSPISRSPTAGFFLPPAFDFSVYRSTSPTSSSAPTSPQPLSTTCFALTSSRTSSQSTSSPRILTPSSSRSSLSSVQSPPVQGEIISTQARSELRDYTNSFDQVRDWRRRMTAS